MTTETATALAPVAPADCGVCRCPERWHFTRRFCLSPGCKCRRYIRRAVRCPYCGSVMVNRLCPRCDSRAAGAL